MSGDFDSNNGAAENYISSNERAYFFITPNIVDDMDLSVYAFRLYCHIKRVAGEVGACWQSTSTLAERCKMSAGKVSDAKQELVEVGLIQIENKQDKNLIYHHITINDIWRENLERYVTVQEVNGNGNQRSPHERYRSPHERQRSPGETKKNPIKKNTVNKNQKAEEEEQKPAAAATTTYPEELAIWFEKQSSIKGKEVDIEIAKAAVEQWLRDIKNSGKKWRHENYECIRERYALLEVDGNGKQKYSLPDDYQDDDTSDDNQDQDDITEVDVPERIIRQFESISAGWPIGYRIGMKPISETDEAIVIGVGNALRVDVVESHYGKSLQNAFMKPVVFCEVAAL